jgi:tRNA threonylcarbamoyladenosine biosynthesis protein TsaE
VTVRVAPIEVRVDGPDEMRALGAALGRVAVAGDRFLLAGPFGVGKTTFVQGLAVGLDVTEPISSPSFVLEQQHRGRLTLYHIDLFRLDRLEPSLLDELEDDLFGDGVAAVEWPELLLTDLRDGAAWLEFEQLDEQTRRVRLHADAERLRTAACAA